MRFRRTFGVLAIVILLGIGFAAHAPDASARVDVSFGVFVDSLSPYGTWFDYPGYGRVWRPAHIGHGWRPYTDGRWVWADDYGWVWDGNEDWGWATYHYGRWMYDGHWGWVWIPGYEWAPAWVDWRYGPDYIGWVPLPPARIAVISLLPSYWSFVPRRSFFDPRLRNVVFIPDHRVFGACRDEVRLDHDHGHWFNRGVDRHSIERFAHASAPVVNVRDVDRPGPTRFVRGGDHGDELHIYRPNIREASADHAPPGDARFRDRAPERHAPAPPPTAVRPQDDRSFHPNAPIPTARDRALRTPVPREPPTAQPRDERWDRHRPMAPAEPEPQRMQPAPPVERDAAVPRSAPEAIRRPEPMPVQPQPMPYRDFRSEHGRPPMQAPTAVRQAPGHIEAPQARVEGPSGHPNAARGIGKRVPSENAAPGVAAPGIAPPPPPPPPHH